MSPNVAGFAATNVGNSLLFAAYDVPETVTYPWNSIRKGYTNSPITVSTYAVTSSGGSGSVTNSSDAAQTVIIDLYRFYYYYLTTAKHETAV